MHNVSSNYVEIQRDENNIIGQSLSGLTPSVDGSKGRRSSAPDNRICHSPIGNEQFGRKERNGEHTQSVPPTQSINPNRRYSAPSTTTSVDPMPGTSNDFVTSHLLRRGSPVKRKHEDNYNRMGRCAGTEGNETDYSNGNCFERHLAFEKYRKEVESKESLMDIMKDMHRKVDLLTQNENKRLRQKEDEKRELQERIKEMKEDILLKESMMQKEREDCK